MCTIGQYFLWITVRLGKSSLALSGLLLVNFARFVASLPNGALTMVNTAAAHLTDLIHFLKVRIDTFSDLLYVTLKMSWTSLVLKLETTLCNSNTYDALFNIFFFGQCNLRICIRSLRK